MNIEEFKSLIIGRGIKSCKSEKKKSCRIGCLEGFEICKSLKTPREFETILQTRRQAEHELSIEHLRSPRKKRERKFLRDYWQDRYATLQIEYVFERLKIAWNHAGVTDYPTVSARAVIDYGKLVGVKN